jgi:hypothetical protein
LTGTQELVRVIVEVKTRVPSIGDVMRQLFMYRDHSGKTTRSAEWITKTALVLATPTKLSATDKRALSESGITTVHLGDTYTAWKRVQSEASANSEPEISM